MKLLSACFLFLTFQSSIHAQKDSGIVFNEFLLSINRTEVEDSNTSDGTGFGIAVYRAQPLSNNWKLAFGLEYNQSRQRKKLLALSGIKNAEIRLNYISTPLLMRYFFTPSKYAYLEAGPYADIEIFSKVSDELVDGIDNFNYGMAFSYAVLAEIHQFNLTFKISYQHGFSNIGSDYDKSSAIYNKYFLFGIGLSRN